MRGRWYMLQEARARRTLNHRGVRELTDTYAPPTARLVPATDATPHHFTEFAQPERAARHHEAAAQTRTEAERPSAGYDERSCPSPDRRWWAGSSGSGGGITAPR